MDGNVTPARARQRFTSETGRAAQKLAQSVYERGKSLRGIGKRQRKVLKYITEHPGCTGADIDRATNPNAGQKVGHSHAITYDCVNRLLKRGILKGEREAFRVKLYVANDVSVDDIVALVSADEPQEAKMADPTEWNA